MPMIKIRRDLVQTYCLRVFERWVGIVEVSSAVNLSMSFKSQYTIFNLLDFTIASAFAYRSGLETLPRTGAIGSDENMDNIVTWHGI